MQSPYRLTPEKKSALLSLDRLDIAIKARFIRHLLHGDDGKSEKNYRLHVLQRTNGVEPRSEKRTVDDYIAELRKLISSMQSVGFDAKYPIRIDCHDYLRRGAHRLACGLVLDIPMFWAVSRPARRFRPWGREQLLKAGISRHDVERAENEIQAWKSR